MIDLEPGEEIRAVEGFPNYWVTSFGRVISGPNFCHPGRYIELSPNVTKKGKGYKQVVLCRESGKLHRYIHDLVAKAFIENPNNLPEVNHIRGEEKTNNRVDNLEWSTYKHNIQHSLRTGLKKLSEDWGITKSPVRQTYKKPYQLLMTLDGIKQKHIGYFSTVDEARTTRDRICLERGIVRPLAEAA